MERSPCVDGAVNFGRGRELTAENGIPKTCIPANKPFHELCVQLLSKRRQCERFNADKVAARILS